ncbi:hypothetical protein [Sphingomonas sp. 28-62-11]|uniref:hypothetical protein n=1 Tax=Sphingomonas sp. 28-62-11 TaxID=1970432 RepID=UPI0035A8FEF2
MAAIASMAAFAFTATAASAEKVKKSGVLKGEIVFYKLVDYDGQSYAINQETPIVSLQWNIGSIGIHEGDKWEICARSRFRDPCMILTESVPKAEDIGIMGGIGSARQIK